MEGVHSECSKCREASRPSPGCRHSEKMSIMCPTSPAGPPVDVGMRIDVASIDMVSEVNMVSGLRTRPASRLTQMRKERVPMPSAFHWRSSCPGPGVHSACAPHSDTHTLLSLVCIFDTHTRATAVFRRKRTQHYLGKDGFLSAADRVGRSLSVTSAGFPLVF